MEVQTAGKLRASGWTLPDAVADDYAFRVYDTRLEPRWLRDLVPDLRLPAPEAVQVVGGDFMLPTHMEDSVALHPTRLRRWGPSDGAPCHVVVPPRPHLADWLRRAHMQMAQEAAGTWISVCCVVQRDHCPADLTPTSLRRLLPQAVTILQDRSLEVRAAAVGERPRILRVQASEDLQLPPRWEVGLLARDKVLVVLSFRRHADDAGPPHGVWIRGALPPLPKEDLELLRLEFILPAATKAATGERALRAAVRKVGSLVDPGGIFLVSLRQVQVSHGAVFALLGVPPATARGWLRGSGCSRLFIRPFWTPSTGAELARDKFSLLWLKGRLEAAPRLWEVLRDVPGFYGLLADGKDLAVRVSADADRGAVQTQVTFALGDAATVRSAEPGVRWWRLGPLTDAEVWQAKALIASVGLELARDELRLARMGPFRSAIYFPARGQPARTSLDDGTWGGSAAQLSPADPPARRKPVTGAALPPQSTWAGPRTSAAPAARPQPSPPVPAPTGSSGNLQPASVATANVWFAEPPSQPPWAPSAPPTSAAPPVGLDRGPGRRSRGRGRVAAVPGVPPPPAPSSGGAPASTPWEQQLAAQLAALVQEVRELRKENAELRRQVELARGLQQHQPYALPALPPLQPPQFVFTPERPLPDGRHRTAAALSPAPVAFQNLEDRDGDIGMPSPQKDVEAKQARRSLALDMGAGDASSGGALPGAAASSSGSASGAAPPPYDA
jgi:hypothetical protein